MGGGADVVDGVGERQLRRHRRSGFRGRDLLVGDHQDRLQALRWSEQGRHRHIRRGRGAAEADLDRVGRRLARRRSRRSADDDAAEQGRGDVVGMPLDLAGAGVDPLARVAELVEVVGGEQPGDDRRGGGPEPARERDLAAQPEGDVVGGMEALEGADEQVVATGADVEPAGVERVGALLDHLQLELERQRRAEDVVAGPEVGGRRRDSDDPAAPAHQITTRRRRGGRRRRRSRERSRRPRGPGRREAAAPP